MSFHYVPSIGEYRKCNAKVGRCPYKTEHYETEEIAQKAQDEINCARMKILYMDNPTEEFNLSNKHSIIRAESLLLGAEYDISVRRDYKNVQLAAIQCGHDLEFFNTKPDLDIQKEIKEFITKDLQTIQEKELIGKASRQDEVYDDYRNALCKQRFEKYIKSSIKELTENANDYSGCGGGTLRMLKMDSPTRGFSFSPYPERSLAIDGDLTEQEFENILKDYYDKNKDLLDSSGHFLGFWRSNFDNKLYIDISIITDDCKKARKLCQNKDQQAFFDFQTFEAIEVDRKATSGQI